MTRRLPLLLALLLLPGVGPAAAAGDEPAPAVWRIGPAEGGGGRVLFASDPMLFRLAYDPEHEPEFAETATADADGKVAADALANGWAFRTIEREAPETVIVSGTGFPSFFVNGERHVGDAYGHGLLRIPVRLRAGTNRILLRVIRGGFTFRTDPAPGDASLSPVDALLPDFRTGTLVNAPGAVVVLNHTGETLRDLVLDVGDGRVADRARTRVAPIPPYGIARARFDVRQLREPAPEDLDGKGRYPLPVRLRRGDAEVGTTSWPIDVRTGADAYVETRISDVDGSVQYHAVRPPARIEPGRRYALFLSLHGAGVKAIKQANAYAPKRDAFVVAPTNRRRFGFDWQDTGRLDAFEALAYALAKYPIDPDRIYLTGHSMGGHGTWYLGSLFATRFAAIAPSAGWSSFFTYAGGMSREMGRDPDLTPFERAQIVNDTDSWLANLLGTPVYVLHGENDDNVPLSESEHLVARLRALGHPDLAFHVQPGAGHWWGRDCVDWNPLFEFCRRHRRVENPLSIRFATPDPGVSDTAAWITIANATEPGLLASVAADADPKTGSAPLTTENVSGLTLHLAGVVPSDEVAISIDGTDLAVPRGTVGLVRGPKGGWAVGEPRPKRGGPFREVFRNRMVFVYGTHGTEEENAATLAQVRYDSETWWYRANGAVPVVRDRDFDPDDFRDRNVIVYGNADTNSAYDRLLPDAPVRVARGAVRIGDEVYEDDLGLYLVYTRPDGAGMVGVVGATTVPATRMLAASRYFISGVAAPDWIVFSVDTLTHGMEGVAASGFFTDDWRLRPRSR